MIKIKTHENIFRRCIGSWGQKLLVFLSIAVVVLFQSSGIFAISQSALDAILNNHPFYIPCSSTSTPTPTTNSVSNIELNFTDPSRGNRQVNATVYLPSNSTPSPVLFFAPGRGQDSEPTNKIYGRFLQATASQGFVVVGADFTDSGTQNTSGKAQDITYLMNQVPKEQQLQDKIETDEFGVFGHSDGGLVASALYGTDPRIKADMVMSGGGALGAPQGPPLLAVVGTNDGYGNYGSTKSLINNASPSYGAYFGFKGANHVNYIMGSDVNNDGSSSTDKSNDGTTMAPVLDSITGAFFKRFLGGDGSSATDLSQIAATHSDMLEFSQKGNDVPAGTSQTPSTSTQSTPANSQSAPTPTPSTASSNPNNIYILGDSITAKASAAYQSLFQSSGDQVTIDASYSRGVNNPGLPTHATNSTTATQTGLQAIASDKSQIQPATKVVIALGTNYGLSNADVDNTINAIKAINSSAQIYWIDTVVVKETNGPNIDGQSKRLGWINAANSAIYAEATKDGYSVISWAKLVNPKVDPTKVPSDLVDTNNYIDTSDHEYVHPNPTGISALTSLVGGSIGINSNNQASNSSSMCCGTGSTGVSIGGDVHFPQGADVNALGAKIDDYISKTKPGSPMIGYGVTIAQDAQKYNVNPALFLGVAQIESQFGTSQLAQEYPGNVWGATPGGSGASALNFGSMQAGIEAYFKNLTSGTYSQGLNDNSIEEILFVSTPHLKGTSTQDQQDLQTYLGVINNAYTALYGSGISGANPSGSPTSGSISSSQSGPEQGLSGAASTGNSNASANSGSTIIALDPGHSPTVDPNSKDPQTGLYNEDYENDPEMANAYTAATKIKALLESAGYQVFMTKNSADEQINLTERAQRANNSGAALLVTMHSNTDGVNVLMYPDANSHRTPSDGPRVDGTNGLVNPGIETPSQQDAQVMAPIIAQETPDSNYKAQSFNQVYGSNGLVGNGKNPGNTPVQTILSSIPEVYSEINQNLLPTDGFAKAMSDAIEKAVPLSNSSNQSNTCTGSSNGVVAGNVIATAMNLAWPDDHGHQGVGSEKPIYRSTWAQYDAASNTTDCGAFVATVMISSGADPNYPKVQTTTQMAYVEGSNKYQIIKNPTSTAQLQPGDILITDSHTQIYVGNQGFPGYDSIGASLGDHTPEATTSSWMFGDPSLIVARLK